MPAGSPHSSKAGGSPDKKLLKMEEIVVDRVSDMIIEQIAVDPIAGEES
jgi:hypothetical protein